MTGIDNNLKNLALSLYGELILNAVIEANFTDIACVWKGFEELL